MDSKYEKRIELNIFLESPYGPTLGSKVQKIPGKNCIRDNAHGDNMGR
jgi:hypothetical protein